MSTRSHTDLIAHVVWAVKGRASLLREREDGERSALFERKALDVGATILVAGCAADHVHVLVRFPATVTLSTVVQRLEGASSRLHNLSQDDESLRWQDGYWAQSCDPNDLAAIVRYVRTQRDHHRAATEREAWELAFEGRPLAE